MKQFQPYYIIYLLSLGWNMNLNQVVTKFPSSKTRQTHFTATKLNKCDPTSKISHNHCAYCKNTTWRFFTNQRKPYNEHLDQEKEHDQHLPKTPPASFWLLQSRWWPIFWFLTQQFYGYYFKIENLSRNFSML